MKLSHLPRNYAPLILSDIGKPADRDLPSLTDEQILAMQPESTQWLIKNPGKDFVIGENWTAEKLNVVENKDGSLSVVNKSGEIVRSVSLEEKQARLKDRKHRDDWYKADLTPVVRPDNINGQYDGGTSRTRKNIAKNAMEYHCPKIQRPEPMPAEQKKSLLQKMTSLFNKEIDQTKTDEWVPYSMRMKK